jgi:DNA-binding NarL/FixJ family response regulator
MDADRAMRVAVLEDQLLTREGLVRLLTAEGVVVVAAVRTVPELLKAVALQQPDAVTLDVRVPPSFTDEGLRAAAAVRRDHPATGVVVLSQYTELAFVEPLLASGSGSVGYLLKDRLLEPDALTDALRRVVRGELVIDPAIVAELLARRRPLFATMTEREVEVLAAIAEGLTNAGIAARLRISDRTVEVHVQHVFEKLRVGDDPRSNRRVLAALTYLDATR